MVETYRFELKPAADVFAEELSTGRFVNPKLASSSSTSSEEELELPELLHNISKKQSISHSSDDDAA